MEDGRHLTNRLLSRIPFVRTSIEEAPPSQAELQKGPPTSPPVRRKRKGSLRKALLTTGHIVASSRNAREFSHPAASSDPHDHESGSPIELSRDQYGSTTDEDNEGLTLRSRSSSGTYQQIAPPAPTSNPSLSRRRSSRSTVAASIPALPLVNGIPASMDPLVTGLPRHDYSETEWWGWIILLATWIVFVVGMGSCLEVWSWAWDVGETPYAPPELEDDPTLPIVGYYPALIIMTGVMAWVWVIVAWVGMKYFRHAIWDGEDY
jgi:hypothetical protein